MGKDIVVIEDRKRVTGRNGLSVNGRKEWGVVDNENGDR